jgi:hypothetical protein
MDLVEGRHMVRMACFCLLVVILLCNCLHAQISPGELSKAHAGLEGMGHCTDCHAMAKAVSNDKCLQCHTQIQSRMSARTGLHALYQGRQCLECHKEHHGRNFPVFKLDVNSFNHSTVGFALQGGHLKLSCQQCHKRDYVKAEDVLKDGAALAQGTYLGLSGECLSCHVDTHKAQFNGSCLRCHAMDGWKPASKFDHNTARFSLTGLHQKVECGKCHKKDDKNLVHYAGLQFGSCSACHRDPHQGRFKQTCESCHTTVGWNQIASGHFDHATTRFPLRGRHAAVKCEQCHGAKKGGAGTTLKIVNFSHCGDCHADAHAGQLASRPDKGACESCHDINGFAPSTFTAEQHQRTRFLLSGGHLAIPCRTCHVAETVTAKSPWKLRWMDPGKCESCHKDIHRKQFASAASNGCRDCHSTEGWRSVRYSHERTRFPLRGKHLDLACAQCHLVTGTVAEGRGIPVADTTRTLSDAPKRLLRWSGPIQCTTCHPDVHRGQFEKKMAKGCETCHTTLAWGVLVFLHDSSGFSLTGAHAHVACAKCHLLADRGTSRERRVYAGTPAQCADCHASAKDKQK